MNLTSPQKYITVSPLLLRADTHAKEITLHAGTPYVQKFLDDTARILVYPMDSVVPTVVILHDETPAASFRRAENGDLILSVQTPEEGEYTILLDKANADGTFTELFTLQFYALKDDLFVLNPYKGDFHMHSSCSDGRQPPAYVAATCRRNGFDFMALTDHFQYAPSLTAQKAMADFGCTMLVFPGEEVHAPDNPVHIVNFGGSASVNELIKKDEKIYRDGIAEYMKCLPESYDELTKFQIAASEWVYDQIRITGGLAIYSHPFWAPRHHYYVGAKVNDIMLKRRNFDAVEVFGGFYLEQTESNMLSLSRWQQENLAGSQMLNPVGVSDCHDCDADLAGWYYTIVFAEKPDFKSIAAAIRNGRCVAVHQQPGCFPIAAGEYRLVKFTYFLLREFYPRHDELCRDEGEAMRRELSGNGSDAAKVLALYGNRVWEYMASVWEK